MNEFQQILEISSKYLDTESQKSLIIELQQNVKTENIHLQSLLANLKEIVDPTQPPASYWLWVSFYTLVISHLLIVFGVLISFFVLPFMVSWYVALPIMTFIWFFSTSPIECKLTKLENYFRKKLGLRPIRGFVSHYLYKPLIKLTRQHKITN